MQFYLFISLAIYIAIGIALLVIGPFRREIDKAVGKVRVIALMRVINGHTAPSSAKVFLFLVILSIGIMVLWPFFISGVLKEGHKITRESLEDNKDNEINKSWLKNKITLEEAETSNLVKDDRLGPAPIPFGFVNNHWKSMIAKMEEGDELWEFCSSSASWQYLAGREGIALIRNGQVIDYILTRMN